jgi:hypothetical protein
MLGQTSPLRWGFDAWAAIGAISGCVVLAAVCALSLIGLSLPSPGFLLLGVILSFLVGLILSLLVAVLLWLVAVPLWWSVRWLLWRLVGAAVAAIA